MKCGARIAFVWLAVFTAVLPLMAAPIVINGKVVDENGAPVREARISVGAVIASSDPAGMFRLELPAAGTYAVSAEREGFFLFTNQNVAITEEAPLEIHLNHQKELAE